MPQPLELILARNLVLSVVIPALLIDANGAVVLYNTAAGELVGQRFEDVGRLSAEEWTEEFGLRDEHGAAISLDDLPLRREVEDCRPAHGRFRFRSAHGRDLDVNVTAIPIAGPTGLHGAIVLLCRVDSDDPSMLVDESVAGG
jgi:PAS domain-containing protein